MTFAQDCLKDKVMLITGGLGAIGKFVVKGLIEHGGKVMVNDLQPGEEARNWFRAERLPAERCTYFQGDTTQWAAARAMVEKAVTAFGRLDVALCHAGISQACAILEYSEKDWDRMLDINLKGAFLVAQAAARAMVAQKIAGKIIFTSSWVQDVPWPKITPYNVSKSGMKMLMRGMARELAGHSIRVNSIAPGIVAVGMAKRQWDNEPDYRARAQKAIPLGHMQPPETLVDAFLFLCSDASDYITGATLLVDGGCSLYPMD